MDAKFDATFWLAIAGIAGTLLGALLGPVLSECMRRNSVRAEQFSAQRLVVYADLLRATARFADNTQTWAVAPLEELAETEDEELNRVFSLVRVTATPGVYKEVRTLEDAVRDFNRLYADAQPHHRRLREAADRGEGSGEDGLAITQRMSLGSAAETVREAHRHLEEVIRREMRP
ncbi:hypothetical protein AB0D14_38525 [Streptomyces sp. NPDC048484]|uniref:hypothetical protein n=1 Tax=Streptomyces sp. NPDC048484 TaxID=3155146 RepID=UPI00344740B1